MPPQTTSEIVRCNFCDKEFRARGLQSHQRACPARNLSHNSDNSGHRDDPLNIILETNEHAGTNAMLLVLGGGDPARVTVDSDPQALNREADLDYFQGIDDHSFQDPPDYDVPPLIAHELEADDIKVVFHPSTAIPDQLFHFDDYCGPESIPANLVNPLSDIETRPWRPFRTKLDFEIAEVMLDAHMNTKQIEKMLSLIHEATQHPEKFTLANPTDLSNIWNIARETRTEMFVKKTVSVEYKGKELQYDVYLRPIWSWCLELLRDKDTVSRFVWDAQRLFKWNEIPGQFERFLDEPWTADAWWNFQSTISADAKPFCIILYADKTRLSSFGTEKGYPVVCRCANLPVDIRNSDGMGGGRLIGWLPIPEEDSQESGKKSFVRLKREIWHRAMYEIISSIELLAETGHRLRCGDNVERTIFPHILILSADYEEQCMMALTRGVNALFPCPTCLVPKADIPNLGVFHELRTSLRMEAIWRGALELSATEREELLKSYGLRDVENIFWSLSGVDIYSALSWDRLHAYHGGLFSDHILVEIRSALKDLGGRSEAIVDAGLQEIPRWPGLYHFKSLSSTGEFSDGAKFEDLSKVLIFASVHVLTQANCPNGFLLLKLLRSYLELDMYASLTVHTDVTLKLGKEEFLRFDETLRKYRETYPTKNWDFPKAHTHQHMFRDIQMKGVTRNYNTKPSEKMNGPLKKYYRHHTNFKDVAAQILKVSEKDVAATVIRTDIERLAEWEERKTEQQALIEEEKSGFNQTQAADITLEFKRVVYGSKRSPLPVEELGMLDDVAFQNFRTKLGSALARLIPEMPRVTLQGSHLVTPFQFMKVHYASVIDWRWKPNIIRANPNFHNKPRYDYALVQVEGNECIFVQVLYIFQVQYLERIYNLTLVLPFDAPRLADNRGRDTALRLTRLHPRRRTDTIIIDANTIIRGGLVTADLASDGRELLVVDPIDEDMWWRLKSVELITRAKI